MNFSVAFQVLQTGQRAILLMYWELHARFTDDIGAEGGHFE
jgi:hypothetical protein